MVKTLAAHSPERVAYRESRPCSQLAPYIHRYWQLTSLDPLRHPALNRVLPDGCTDIVLNLGDPTFGEAECLAPRSRSRITFVGAMTSPNVIWHKGSVDLLGVRFRPGGAHSALGMPLHELTDTSVSLDVINNCLRRGMEWVAEAASPSNRIQRLEGTLLKQFRPAGTEKDPIREAVDAICRSCGRITIARLESLLGISTRTLERRFLEQIGLRPKMFCRIARFQCALAFLNHRPIAAAADLVHIGGFFDQSHLLREFRALAGLLPSGWTSERSDVGFVQYIEPLLNYTGVPGIHSQEAFSECQDIHSVSGWCSRS